MTRDEVAYWYWRAVLPGAVVDAIVEAGEALDKSEATIRLGGGEGGRFPEFRSCAVAWFPPEHWVAALPLHFGYQAATKAGWGVRITGLKGAQYTLYDGARGDKYDWHSDGAASGRVLSVVIQLSEATEYAGGELQLDLGSEVQTPDVRPKGSVIVFPAQRRHRVAPVTAGFRRSLVAWLV